MEDSLLWLIRKEDSLATRCDTEDMILSRLIGQMRNVEANPIECDAKRRDIENCENAIEEQRMVLRDMRQDLAQTRTELGAYIKKLIEQVDT